MKSGNLEEGSALMQIDGDTATIELAERENANAYSAVRSTV